MKGHEFKRWRKSLNFNQKEAADALGLKRRESNVHGLWRQRQQLRRHRVAADEPVGLLEVDGEPVQVATPTRGDAGTVTACDYVSLLADPTNTTQSTVADDTRERLAERTATLETTCVPT